MPSDPAIITNGDHAAEALAAAFPGRTILPWRDALTEGPVPDLPDDAFRDRRAAHLAGAFGLAEATVRSDFETRDAAFDVMMASRTPVALWFETDLHDQLQLLDILSRVARHSPPAPMALIQAPPPLPSHDLPALETQAQSVSVDDLAAAVTLWAAVRAATPDAMARATAIDGPWPAVRTALRRLLQELPAPVDGLSRIEREIVRAVARGSATPLSAFRVYMGTEDLPFLGDAGFFGRLIALATVFDLIDGVPLTPVFDRAARQFDHGFLSAPLALTARGRAVLAGEYDLAGHPRLDRWVGGTHVRPGAAWRWDDAEGRLVAPA